MAISLGSLTSGALLSVFTLGICFPWANTRVSVYIFEFKIIFIVHIITVLLK